MKKKMQRIQWKPQFSVGFEELDKQHRKLFQITNKIMDSYETGETDLLEPLTELGDYLKYHFQEEQNIMALMQYPRLSQHSERHGEFIRSYISFLDRYEAGDPDLAYNILLFLFDWLTGHILNNDDPGYRDYYRRKKARMEKGERQRQISYLDEKGVGTVVCPECQSSHSYDFSKFKGKKQFVKVKCPCGPIKEVNIESRTTPRKDTKLFGKYVQRGKDGQKGIIRINNLSFGGASFTTYEKHKLQVGDKLTVTFELDDSNKSRIEKTMEVRNVKDKTIGAKFILIEGQADEKLGIYLMADKGVREGVASDKKKKPKTEDISWVD